MNDKFFKVITDCILSPVSETVALKKDAQLKRDSVYTHEHTILKKQWKTKPKTYLFCYENQKRGYESKENIICTKKSSLQESHLVNLRVTTS